MYTCTEKYLTGILFQVLASVIYHSGWIISIANESGGNPFSCIPLLNHPQLLWHLKEKVTIKKSKGISCATGIPPHIEQIIKLQRELLSLCQLSLEKADGLLDNFLEKINTVFEEGAVKSGQIIAKQIKNMFDDFQATICKDVQETISTMRNKEF